MLYEKKKEAYVTDRYGEGHFMNGFMLIKALIHPRLLFTLTVSINVRMMTPGTHYWGFTTC